MKIHAAFLQDEIEVWRHIPLPGVDKRQKSFKRKNKSLWDFVQLAF
jgi:hypothetical protein